MQATRWERLLITGAAGRLGRQLRTQLRDLARVTRSTDLRGLDAAADGEETMAADLADFSAVQALVRDVDVILHFGAVMPQSPWEDVLQANIIGSYHLFEAARQAGVKRIIFASSHHAIGMYERTQQLDCDAPPRPGNLYGLSKAFGENLARMYFDKHGIEVACLRIGSCFEQPGDERMLATWLSHDDLLQLCRRCLQAPRLGYTVVYGVSDNSRRWWSNDAAGFLGFEPRDSADRFAAQLPAACATACANDRSAHLQGGRFTALIP